MYPWLLYLQRASFSSASVYVVQPHTFCLWKDVPLEELLGNV